MTLGVESDVQEKKPASIKVFIIALILVSLVAVAGGWFVGTQLNAGGTYKTASGKEPGKENENSNEVERDALSREDKSIVELDPILAALQDSDDVWLRMQLIVVSDDKTNLEKPEIKARMGSDITALVKTLTLEQISGPSGLIHLKEDLLDRVRLTTNGQVEDLMIMSIIAE